MIIWQEILRTIRTATLWPSNSFLSPVANSYAPKSVLERLLGPIVAGNRHAPGSLSSLLVQIRVSRH